MTDRPARRLTDAEILAQVPAASARYDRVRKLVVVELTNGAFFGFPAALGQGLAGATRAELADVEVSPGGEALRWPRLDVDLRVPALLGGVFGTRAWMRVLAQAGGRATSEAKARAARENGAKGGRPRKAAGSYVRGPVANSRSASSPIVPFSRCGVVPRSAVAAGVAASTPAQLGA